MLLRGLRQPRIGLSAVDRLAPGARRELLADFGVSVGLPACNRGSDDGIKPIPGNQELSRWLSISIVALKQPSQR